MLQTLFTNVPFRKAVYEWEPKQQNANDQQALQMRALQKLFGLMQLGKKSIYDPHEFASTLSLNSVLQQDVQVRGFTAVSLQKGYAAAVACRVYSCVYLFVSCGRNSASCCSHTCA